jgi:hypothetical protein
MRPNAEDAEKQRKKTSSRDPNGTTENKARTDVTQGWSGLPVGDDPKCS